MMNMIFNKNDYVVRVSHNKDIIFKIINIVDDNYILKGVDLRIIVDSPVDDLEKVEYIPEEDEVLLEEKLDRSNYFYLPGKILHIDGDDEYLERCLKYYKKAGLFAIGKKIAEDKISEQIMALLREFKPDCLVITGHDAYIKKNNNISDLNNYKNSRKFVSAIVEARKYEKLHDKLVIVAGACQSDYEALIKAGANFASSPKRINIHALDPAIIAASVALSERNKEINLLDILDKTKYGIDGIGGIITNGLMYVGYPRQ